MRDATEKNDELELPELDGEDETSPADVGHDDVLVADDGGDAFDDATGEDGSHDDFAAEGAEEGWLVDADAVAGLDLGAIDLMAESDGSVLGDTEASDDGLGDLIAEEAAFVADAGEEGPLSDDETLREEDLPLLDADDDRGVSDEDLYDRAGLQAAFELRWDDRAWARATDVTATPDDAEESGVLTAPGDDPSLAARDDTWKRLDTTGDLMAATLLPGGSVVVALRAADRVRASIVRIREDGEARIIAEIEPRTTKGEDDGESCVVTFLKWDSARGCLFVGGNFGVEAYRPR